jgi:lysine biosynthesis protein LysW
MGRKQSNRRKTRCPECQATIYLRDDVELWDPVTCPECHTSLEVINLHPLQVDYMEAEWDDEDQDDYSEIF